MNNWIIITENITLLLESEQLPSRKKQKKIIKLKLPGTWEPSRFNFEEIVFLDKAIIEDLKVEGIIPDHNLAEHDLEINLPLNYQFQINLVLNSWRIIKTIKSKSDKDPYEKLCYHKEGECKINKNKQLECFYFSKKKEVTEMLDAVYKQLVYSKYYITVSYELWKERNDHHQRHKYSNAEDFWFMTTHGFRFLPILLVAQVYSDDSVSLNKIICKFHSSYHKWQQSDSKLLPLNKVQIDQDKNFCDKEQNNLLRVLFNQRDKAIAHWDKEEVLKYQNENNRKRRIENTKKLLNSLPDDPEEALESLERSEKKLNKDKNPASELKRLEEKEINELIQKGIDICERYSKLLNHELREYSLNYDDYKNLLNFADK